MLKVPFKIYVPEIKIAFTSILIISIPTLHSLDTILSILEFLKLFNSIKDPFLKLYFTFNMLKIQ
jgi:hypothetical protein